MKAQLPVLFAIGTALCWGCYGPVLGKARLADPGASPFKPYLAIGFAYLVIAIIGGAIGMVIKGDSFQFTGETGWATLIAFGAGTLGALGAFNLTMAMSTGGGKMPQVVMSVVFGGAVTVAAIVSVIQLKGQVKVSPMLWVGIVGMGICIVIVAANTPHAHPPKKHAPETEATTSAAISESTADSGTST